MLVIFQGDSRPDGEEMSRGLEQQTSTTTDSLFYHCFSICLFVVIYCLVVVLPSLDECIEQESQTRLENFYYPVHYQQTS
jgi:hypothetical protein